MMPIIVDKPVCWHINWAFPCPVQLDMECGVGRNFTRTADLDFLPDVCSRLRHAEASRTLPSSDIFRWTSNKVPSFFRATQHLHRRALSEQILIRSSPNTFPDRKSTRLNSSQ